MDTNKVKKSATPNPPPSRDSQHAGVPEGESNGPHLIRGTNKHLPPSEGGTAGPVTAEYLILQAALPNAEIQDIGILLLDAVADRLYVRLRRDVQEYAGDESDFFEALETYIPQRARELGAKNYIAWMESSLSNTVRISERESVVVADYYTALNDLYTEHIKPNVLEFRTHLPKYTLEAAAGKFGKEMIVEPEGWVEVSTDHPLTEDMFVIHVKGGSMEPLIPDPSLCAFRSKIPGSLDDKVLLLEYDGEEKESLMKADGNGKGGFDSEHRYTVKVCHLSATVDPNPNGDGAWAHHRVILASLNPAFESWEVAPNDVKALGEFVFVV